MIINVEQNSSEWLRLKLGVISASNAHKLISKKGTETRSGYLSELVAQVVTGDFDEVTSQAMEWGKNNEQSAKMLYQFETANLVETCGFYMTPDCRAGCSPDGLIKGQKKGLEIKAPFSSRIYVDFVTQGKIKKEYLYQVQFSMWVTGLDSWDFANYDPRMRTKKLHVVTIEKDPEIMNQFDEVVPEFISDMDRMLEIFEVKWGSQWESLDLKRLGVG